MKDEKGLTLDISKLYGGQKEISEIPNLPRFANLIKKSIHKLELNLDGLVILTEAASGYYVCTPLIAAMSGSEKVYAYVRDSKYGKAKDIIANTGKLALMLGVRENIEFVESLGSKIISESDIVTNLGPLRPITKKFIDNMKDTAVIPLMRETWEFRDGEIDMKACESKGIIVLGTNENHPHLLIFDYLGHLCAKKLFEVGIEILNSKIIVCGGEDFGLNIIKYLRRLGAEVKGICEEKDITNWGAQNIGNLVDGIQDIEAIKDADAIVVTSYPHNAEVIGDNGLISASKLKTLCPGISVFQFKGNLDRESVIKENIPLFPEKSPKYGHMSWTLNSLGPKAVIDLQSSGLKVGEIMSRLRLEGNNPQKAIELALENDLVQGF